MQIFLRSDGQLRPVQVNNDATTEDLRVSNRLRLHIRLPLRLLQAQIAEVTGCDPNDFFFNTHREFLPGMIVDVAVKVRGGKTHGRLNNAGKVKGQTPRIPPSEKPKKKTGRARRREQYENRFSSKVSPNSNAWTDFPPLSHRFVILFSETNKPFPVTYIFIVDSSARQERSAVKRLRGDLSVICRPTEMSSSKTKEKSSAKRRFLHRWAEDHVDEDGWKDPDDQP